MVIHKPRALSEQTPALLCGPARAESGSRSIFRELCNWLLWTLIIQLEHINYFHERLVTESAPWAEKLVHKANLRARGNA